MTFPPTHDNDATDIAARCAGVSVLVMDVDGVLTDGVIAVDDDGVELKHFHVRDGWAISTWRKLGGRSAILSGRSSRAVTRRAAELGVDRVVQGFPSKAAPFRTLLDALGVGPREVAYIGDDLPDLPVLAAAGLAACPADAAPEVRERCHYVTAAGGGRGAVREVVELILKHQGRWHDVIRPFTTPGAEGP